MQRLADILSCAACFHPALEFQSGPALKCRECGWTAPAFGPISDFYRPVKKATVPPAASRSEVAAFFADRIGLPRDAVIGEFEETLGDLPLLDHDAFDAEELLFYERFGVENEMIHISVEQVYAPASLPVNAKSAIAVRIRNGGEFALSSLTVPPLVLSYHWLRDGEMIHFEGMRSALPVRLGAGKEVTMPVDIMTPEQPGEYTLRLTALIEGKRWLSDFAHDIPIPVSLRPPAVIPTTPDLPDFTGTEDGALAARFVDANINLGIGSRVLEIGGGMFPSFMETKSWPGLNGDFICNDITMRLLRFGYATAQTKFPAARNFHFVRFDATHIPAAENAFTTVIFCRSLHHFEDVPGVLRECHRVLKPGGQMFLLCEPVASVYDDHTRGLIAQGVNEQVFPPGVIENLTAACGFRLIKAVQDWGFSFKGCFEKTA